MPALSPTMESGIISKWLINEGDSIGPGDGIAEIETDKASMTFEAQDDFIVKFFAKFLVDVGKEIKIGTPIIGTLNYLVIIRLKVQAILIPRRKKLPLQ
jgi:pyruvate/2-oxoglutarate dehydrogenase complex dihydrolipoamide acyltransferase (E2) component